MTCIPIHYGSEREWLDLRQQHITGTDVSAIAGCNPWKTALDVYADKVMGYVPADNTAMRMGRALATLNNNTYQTTGEPDR